MRLRARPSALGVGSVGALATDFRLYEVDALSAANVLAPARSRSRSDISRDIRQFRH